MGAKYWQGCASSGGSVGSVQQRNSRHQHCCLCVQNLTSISRHKQNMTYFHEEQHASMLILIMAKSIRELSASESHELLTALAKYSCMG
jgi:hypothetical protein